MSAIFRPVALCVIALAATPLASGQTSGEPALAPERVFSQPGIMSIGFAPDGKTVYLTEQRSLIMQSHLRNGKWSQPEPLEFARQYANGDVFISPDGKQMFFWSTRPINGKTGQMAIWVATRTPTGWSEPVLAAPSFSDGTVGTGFPAVAANGNLYFFGQLKDSLGGPDIYRARRVGDHYAAPENLGPPVNSAGREYDAYISPDESFIIFSRTPPNEGRSDIYISTFKDGAWTAPRKLGPEVNETSECCPSLSRDGRYFFFNGTRNGKTGIYRIDAAALGLGADAGKKPVAGAELFEEGTIARPGAFSISFSPDGQTAYFAENHGYITESRLQKDGWSTPEPVPASLDYYQRDASVSPDGKQLFFMSVRPRETEPERSQPALWVVDRTATGWSEPKDLGNEINGRMSGAASPVATASGTLYFAGAGRDEGGAPRGDPDIYRAKRAGNAYAAPENLGPVINSDRGEYGVYVSADEKYMVLVSDRPGGSGGADLYISRWKDGAWTAPRNLGPKINSSDYDAAPAVSPDGKYLYFFSSREGTPGFYRVEMAALGMDEK